MVLRKVDNNGRITIPNELCEKFNIKKDDIIEVTNDKQHILIKKYQPEFVCAITGKITDQGQVFGNSFISNEGLQLIKENMNDLEK